MAENQDSKISTGDEQLDEILERYTGLQTRIIRYRGVQKAAVDLAETTLDPKSKANHTELGVKLDLPAQELEGESDELLQQIADNPKWVELLYKYQKSNSES